MNVASDSRATFARSFRDECQKVFAFENHGLIVAFCGDVELCSKVIHRFTSSLYRNAKKQDLAYFGRMIQSQLSKLTVKAKYPSEIVLCGCESGSGFGVIKFKSSPDLQGWRMKTGSNYDPNGLPKPFVIGSGQRNFHRIRLLHYREDLDQLKTHQVFSILVRLIDSNSDPKTGGVVQMATLHQSGQAIEVGICWGGRPYLKGRPIGGYRYSMIKEWRDRRFAFQSTSRRCQPKNGQPRHFFG